LKPSVAGALFYIFIESIRNVDVAVLLSSPGSEYGPVTLFEYFRVGQWGEAAAGGVIYLVLLIGAVSLAKFRFNVKFSLKGTGHPTRRRMHHAATSLAASSRLWRPAAHRAGNGAPGAQRPGPDGPGAR
jgi:hypothetical protein